MAIKRLIESTALGGLIFSTPIGAFAASPVPYTWTGIHFGLDAGYAWGNNSTTCDFVPGLNTACQGLAVPNLKSKGGAFGSEVGADWQYQNWVVGAAADFSLLNLHGNSYFSSVDAGKSDQIASRYDWLGTARGRVGYAVGQSLFYGTGGFAFAHVSDSYLNDLATGNSGAFSSSGVRTGWTVGGGWEYALNPNWSVKLEYLHVDLRNSNLDISGAVTNLSAGAAPGSAIMHFNNSFDLGRVGVNYKW
jgi:outer membrane immunogenic protein